ncbi:MAG: CapA family protein [Deltaproteobacteria bacterium]|jgi:hypothetical protein|nr:CapA family protein [Deltaproteobacteria bacterium]
MTRDKRFSLGLALGLALVFWLSAQGGASAQGAPEGGLRVAAVGDIMMGTENLLPPDGGAGFFKDVAPYLKDRDLVIGNLEGPLTDRGAPTKAIVPGRSYCFRTPPSYGRFLKEAGFTAMSLANNHANDYGPEGRAQTIEVLESLGIAHAGAPGQVTVFRAGDREVAFLALAPNRGCQNINDIQGAVDLVKGALRENPKRLVFVSFHGGAEGTAHMVLPHGPETYLGENRGDLINLSHRLIDAGAAAVIGHGPHVPRALEVYKGHLIAYSLGNFATASGINVKGATGLAPLLLFDIDGEGKVLDYDIVSFRQKQNAGPKPDAGSEAAKVIKDLSDRLAKELAAK